MLATLYTLRALFISDELIKPSKFKDNSGFDVINDDLKQSEELLKSVIKFYQDRVELEKQYAKGLSKLSSKLSTSFVNSSGSVAQSWFLSSKCVEAEAEAHRRIASTLVDNLLPNVQQTYDTLVLERKPFESNVEKATANFVTCRTDEFKCRKKAYQAANYCAKTWMKECNQTNTNNMSGLEYHQDGTGKMDTMSNKTAGTMFGFMGKNFRMSRANSRAIRGPKTRGARVHRSSTMPSQSPRQFYASARQNSVSLEMKNNLEIPPEREAKIMWNHMYAYYKSFVNSEDARIDWHTVYINSVMGLCRLQSERINSLKQSCKDYRDLMCTNFYDYLKMHMVEPLNKHQEIADADRDLHTLRQIAARHIDPSKLPHLPTESKPNPFERAGDRTSTSSAQQLPIHSHFCGPDSSFSVNILTRPTLINPLIGLSRQLLMDIPGEEYAAATQMKNSILPYSPETNRRVSRKELMTKLSYELIHGCLRVVSSDIKKERLTKQGLSNLIQAYSGQPSYADETTIVEARKRLFATRVKLVHLIASWRKLLSALNFNDASSPAFQSQSSGLSNGFKPGVSSIAKLHFEQIFDLMCENVGATSTVFVRWVGVPDLTDDDFLTRSLQRKSNGRGSEQSRLEWPPFPDTDSTFEKFSENEEELLEEFSGDIDPSPLQIKGNMLVMRSGKPALNPLLLQSAQRPEPNGTPKDSSRNQPINPTHFTFNVDRNVRPDEPNVNHLVAGPQPPHLRNGDRMPRAEDEEEEEGLVVDSDFESDFDDESTSQASSAFMSPAMQRGQPHRQSLAEERMAVRRSFFNSDAKETTAAASNATKSNADAVVLRNQNGAQIKTKPNGMSGLQHPAPPKLPNAGHETAKKEPVTSATPINKNVKAAEKSGVQHITASASNGVVRSRFTNKPFECSVTINASSTELVAKALSKGPPNTTPSKQSKGKENGVVPLTKKEAPKKIVKKASSSAMNSPKKAVINSSPEKTPEVKTKSAALNIDSPSKKSNLKSPQFLVKLKQSLKKNSDNPSSFEAQSSQFNKEPSPDKKTQDKPKNGNESSEVKDSSLCIGWAKVERVYDAKSKTELSMNKGDIVSILSKPSTSFWYGELNGKRGRFPVSCVEEF